MNKLEEKFYAIAAQEVASKSVSPGVMAKAFADADGDERKAIASYIRLRVAQQRETHKAALAQGKRDEADRRRIERSIADENERLLKHPPKIGEV